MIFSNKNIFKTTEKTIIVDVEGYKSFLQIMCETKQQVLRSVFWCLYMALIVLKTAWGKISA